MNTRRFLVVVLALLVFTVACGSLLAEEPFRFPEGKHGKGEFKYVNGVPVLSSNAWLDNQPSRPSPGSHS